MKVKCLCGEVIADSTDHLFYKARCIADQDWYDFLESEHPGMGHDWGLTRVIYQCPSCGRLRFERSKGHVVFFQLEGEDKTEENKRLLVSIKGIHWKRILTGTWDSNAKPESLGKGRLFFPNCFGEGFEKFGAWDGLEKKYHELFVELKNNNLLKVAMLKKDGVVVHKWP